MKTLEEISTEELNAALDEVLAFDWQISGMTISKAVESAAIRLFVKKKHNEVIHRAMYNLYTYGLLITKDENHG